MRKLLIAVLLAASTAGLAQCGGGSAMTEAGDEATDMGAACANLASLSIANGQITMAEAVSAGMFEPPMAPGARPLS